VPDVSKDPDYDRINDEVCAELAVPIRVGDQVLGVLNLEALSPGAFTDETEQVVTTLADQVAGALRMAQMNHMLSDLFSRYVAPDLAKLLLDDPERFRTRGERREVSVLFADIRGFTGLMQRLDSERVLALLNDFYAAMGEAIFGRRGSINRILGDGLMAVFGVPERLADHAHAAVHAALDMQRAADALSPRWAEAAGAPLSVVIAINAGEVVVGSIGDPRHLAFTVLGDVVNVASRLETEAKARGARVLVTDAVRAACHGLPVESLGEIELRGRMGRVGIHRLM
jgi:adenylate cyclase